MIEEDVSEQVLDRVESTLLFILDGDQVQPKTYNTGSRRDRRGVIWTETTHDDSKHIPALPIECPLLLNPGIELHALSRLYTDDPDQLITPVSDLVGEATESILVDESDVVQWHTLRPVAKLPRRYHVPGPTGCIFYEEHSREWNCHSPESGCYWRHFRAYHHRTNKWYQVLGPGEVPGRNLKSTRERLTLQCSIQEDVNLFWKIKLSEGKAACVISADGAALLELFKNREAPLTPSGRRRALMHWVRGHVRAPRGLNRTQEVREYLRGVFSFKFGTTDVELFAPSFEDHVQTSRKIQ